MKSNNLIYIVLMILLCTFINAAESTNIVKDTTLYYPHDSTVLLSKKCTIDGAACSTSGSCTVTVYYPDSNIALPSTNMTRYSVNTPVYQYNYSQTDILGSYIYSITCCDQGSCSTNEFNFIIQNSGERVLNLNFSSSTDIFILLVFILLYAVLMGLGLAFRNTYLMVFAVAIGCIIGLMLIAIHWILTMLFILINLSILYFNHK